MMKRALRAAILAAFAATAAPAGTQPPFRTMPTPGVRHYLYEVIQTINGTTRKGYRTEFDLEAKGGALFATIRTTAELDQGAWKPVLSDAACRKAMSGTEARLARVQLYPLDPATAHSLGSSFLATCAPPAIFFPLTDILNVAIIPVSSAFRVGELRAVGETLAYPGFEAAFDRSGESIQETTHGGDVRLAALDPRRALIDWRPLPADITTVERSMQPPMTLRGKEHWAFRVEIDRRSGAIERASTSYDDLDLAIVGAPASVPHVRISRSVTIQRQ
ncbi:MAG: hypothetical protein JWO81_3441 [Alphaproteobacteria bacterium]|nr:hypothetical protein [Alphaproteobacteria bacterium]